ncbi:hypothetical protein GCM10027346_42030 [Hymenobacter seoulensis]
MSSVRQRPVPVVPGYPPAELVQLLVLVLALPPIILLRELQVRSRAPLVPGPVPAETTAFTS